MKASKKTFFSIFSICSILLICSAVLLHKGLRPQARTRNASPQVKTRITAALATLPMAFEPNRGQTDPAVRFLARGKGYTMFLTSKEAVLTLSATAAADAGKPKPQPPAVVRLGLVGSNPEAEIRGTDDLPGRSNYFTGSDPANWQADIPNYAKVRYESVYPGIDLIYYGNQGQLEFDFTVAAGANPDSIRLALDGSDRLEVDAQGNLLVETVSNKISLRKPVAYQEVEGVRHEVALEFELFAQNQVGFRIGQYDSNRALVLDPILYYSTYLGGSSDDTGYAIAVDGNGSTYVTGTTNSTNFPIDSAYQPNKAGATDVFVTRLNTSLSNTIYSTYLGGSADEGGYGIDIDAELNAYLTGGTFSTNFPVLNAFQTTNAGGSDAFVAKLSPNGGLRFSTYLGGTNTDTGWAIAVEPGGTSHVTGSTDSNNFPTLSAYQLSKGGSFDAFVSTFSNLGALGYSTYLGGGSADYGYGIAVDSAGRSYVTGATESSSFPTKLALQFVNSGRSDAFVTKFNTAGSDLVYSTYLGGSLDDYGYGIAVDASNQAYVTGATFSTNFPTDSPMQSSNAGGADAFVTKFNAAGGARVYSTYLGGSWTDYGKGIALDSSNNAYVVSQTRSTDFPIMDPAQSANAGYYDAGVTKLTSGGALSYSTYLGGTFYDYAYGIAVTSQGYAYITGSTSSTDFPMTSAPFQPNNAGSYDAFVSMLADTCPVYLSLSGSPNAAAMLNTMYHFRDDVMLQSPFGNQYVDLFYSHAAEGTWILMRDAALRSQVAQMLWRFQPMFNALIQHKPATLRAQDVQDIETLMEAFIQRAHPALAADLRNMQRGLQDRSLLTGFGVRVVD